MNFLKRIRTWFYSESILSKKLKLKLENREIFAFIFFIIIVLTALFCLLFTQFYPDSKEIIWSRWFALSILAILIGVLFTK